MKKLAEKGCLLLCSFLIEVTWGKMHGINSVSHYYSNDLNLACEKRNKSWTWFSPSCWLLLPSASSLSRLFIPLRAFWRTSRRACSGSARGWLLACCVDAAAIACKERKTKFVTVLVEYFRRWGHKKYYFLQPKNSKVQQHFGHNCLILKLSTAYTLKKDAT